MDKLEFFYNDVLSEIKARISEMLTTEELVRFMDSRCYAYMYTYQHFWHQFYDKVINEEFEILDSAWMNTSYHYNKNPSFMDIKLYKELSSAKSQLERQDIYKKYINRNWTSDSGCLDGCMNVLSGGNYINIKSNSKVKGVINNHLDRDVICLEKLSEDYSGSKHTECVFILRPKAATKKERIEIVAEFFRSKVVEDLAEKKIDDYLELLVSEMAVRIINSKSSLNEYIFNKKTIPEQI